MKGLGIREEDNFVAAEAAPPWTCGLQPVAYCYKPDARARDSSFSEFHLRFPFRNPLLARRVCESELRSLSGIPCWRGGFVKVLLANSGKAKCASSARLLVFYFSLAFFLLLSVSWW